MKLFKSTQASISLIVAFFLALLLITTITVSFLLILENHNQSTTTGVEYQKQTLKGVREQLQATLIDANNSQITITIQNIGQAPTQITQLLVTGNNNSLNSIAINPPINLLPLEKQTITIPCTQQYQNLGILTKNGNIYPIELNPTTQQPTNTPTQTNNPTPTPQTTPTTQPTNTPTTTQTPTTTTPPPNTNPPTPTPTASPTPTSTVNPTPNPTPTTSNPAPTITPSPTPETFDFSISASSSSGTIQQESSISLTLTATLLSGATQEISFSATALPLGSYASFSQRNGNPTFTTTLTIITSSATPTGTYPITITATRGDLTKTLTYTLTVITQQFDYTITVNPTSSSTTAGNSISATVTVTKISGTSKPITLSLNPNGAPASLSSTIGTPNPAFTTTLTITNPSTGTYQITIYASTSQKTKSTTYTLTVNPKPTTTITFHLSGTSNTGTPLTVDNIAYTANNFPLTFNWPIGSTHTYRWTSYQTDESPHITGIDTGYSWNYATSTNNLPTTLTGTITTPTTPATITAHYTRHIYIQTTTTPGGSITPNTGWHTTPTTFTATPNSEYEFNHWTINGQTSTTNPITLFNPTNLQATFKTPTIPLTININDYQNYPINTATIHIYTQQQTLHTITQTNSNGQATIQLPAGTYYVAVMQTTTAYGYSTNFFGWSDGQNGPIRQITLTTPQTLSAIYNTPLTFQNLAGGLGSNLFSVGYWATGTVTTVHGTPIPNLTIQTTWNPQDILERTATTQTTTDGTFNTQTYIGPMATTVYAIDFTMTNPPTGYQPQTTHRHYP